jgi:uncharacterized protein
MPGHSLASLLAGALMGAGLAVSQMINPEKVIAFLDIAGHWDPSLAVVLFSALAVSYAGYRIRTGRAKPLLSETFQIPARKDIDLPLVGGAAVFGIGWGLGGYCPGPAIGAITLGTWEVIVFLPAMLAGFALAGLVMRKL